MFKAKRLASFINLFSPRDFKNNNDKISTISEVKLIKE